MRPHFDLRRLRLRLGVLRRGYQQQGRRGQNEEKHFPHKSSPANVLEVFSCAVTRGKETATKHLNNKDAIALPESIHFTVGVDAPGVVTSNVKFGRCPASIFLNSDSRIS